MTIEEAKNKLEELILFLCGDDNKTYKMDIEALKTALSALEKQIPKKPLSGIDFMGNEFRICCDCSAIVRDGEWRANYCPDCGQALDWSDTDD